MARCAIAIGRDSAVHPLWRRNAELFANRMESLQFDQIHLAVVPPNASPSSFASSTAAKTLVGLLQGVTRMELTVVYFASSQVAAMCESIIVQCCTENFLIVVDGVLSQHFSSRSPIAALSLRSDDPSESPSALVLAMIQALTLLTRQGRAATAVTVSSALREMHGAQRGNFQRVSLTSIPEVVTTNFGKNQRTANREWGRMLPEENSHVCFTASVALHHASYSRRFASTRNAGRLPDGRIVSAALREVMPRATLHSVVEQVQIIAFGLRDSHRDRAVGPDQFQTQLEHICAAARITAPCVERCIGERAYATLQPGLCPKFLDVFLRQTSSPYELVGLVFRFDVVTTLRDFLLCEELCRLHAADGATSLFFEEIGLPTDIDERGLKVFPREAVPSLEKGVETEQQEPAQRIAAANPQAAVSPNIEAVAEEEPPPSPPRYAAGSSDVAHSANDHVSPPSSVCATRGAAASEQPFVQHPHVAAASGSVALHPQQQRPSSVSSTHSVELYQTLEQRVNQRDAELRSAQAQIEKLSASESELRKKLVERISNDNSSAQRPPSNDAAIARLDSLINTVESQIRIADAAEQRTQQSIKELWHSIRDIEVRGVAAKEGGTAIPHPVEIDAKELQAKIATEVSRQMASTVADSQNYLITQVSDLSNKVVALQRTQDELRRSFLSVSQRLGAIEGGPSSQQHHQQQQYGGPRGGREEEAQRLRGALDELALRLRAAHFAINELRRDIDVAARTSENFASTVVGKIACVEAAQIETHTHIDNLRNDVASVNMKATDAKNAAMQRVQQVGASPSRQDAERSAAIQTLQLEVDSLRSLMKRPPPQQIAPQVAQDSSFAESLSLVESKCERSNAEVKEMKRRLNALELAQADIAGLVREEPARVRAIEGLKESVAELEMQVQILSAHSPSSPSPVAAAQQPDEEQQLTPGRILDHL